MNQKKIEITRFILFIIFVGFCFQSCNVQKKELKPNGLITFYSDTNRKYNVFIMQPNGSGQQKLINDDFENVNGIWSPDGKTMIYSSVRNGNSEIYLIDAYGNNEQQLTDNKLHELHLGWSPDSKQIIFSANESDNQEIFIMDVNGENLINITNSSTDEQYPSWSPDGKSILFSAKGKENWKIFQMDVDGKNRKKVTDYMGSGNELQASFAPNGNKIVYTLAQSESKICNIVKMNKDGKNPVRLTNSDYCNEYPFWSPNGESIVFQSNRRGNSQIFSMTRDGKNQICLSNNSNNEYAPSWTWIQEF